MDLAGILDRAERVLADLHVDIVVVAQQFRLGEADVVLETVRIRRGE